MTSNFIPMPLFVYHFLLSPYRGSSHFLLCYFMITYAYGLQCPDRCLHTNYFLYFTHYIYNHTWPIAFALALLQYCNPPSPFGEIVVMSEFSLLDTLALLSTLFSLVPSLPLRTRCILLYYLSIWNEISFFLLLMLIK